MKISQKICFSISLLALITEVTPFGLYYIPLAIWSIYLPCTIAFFGLLGIWLGNNTK